jgi:tetratricopeptide (TPR) repeat protein
MSEPDHTIFSSDHYRIDFFRANVATRRLMISFSELGDHDLEGLGFAGKFALKSNFDVIVIKSASDDWYHGLPPQVFDLVEQFLSGLPERHSWRAAYGSSMGGYAGILFANDIKADVVLALSPQFDITRDWDMRWAGQGAKIGTMRVMDRARVRPECAYVIAYDPVSVDRLHFDRYSEVIPAGMLRPIRVPYAGHPVSFLLGAVGGLKGMATAVLTGETTPAVYRFRDRRESFPEYFDNLAQHCWRRGKLKWARAIMAKAIALDTLNSEFHIRAAQIADASGDLDGAVSHAAIAVAIEPDHPYMTELLSRFLHLRGLNAAALHYIDAAIALEPGETYFVERRAAIVERMQP